MNITEKGYSPSVDMDGGGSERVRGGGEGGDSLRVRRVCEREIGALTLLWEVLKKKEKDR